MKIVSLTGRARRLALAGVSAVALSAGIVSAGMGIADTTVAPPAAVTLPSVADVVEAVKPGVVTITSEIEAPQAQAQMQGPGGMPPEEFFRHFFGENGPFPGMPGMPGAPGAPGNGPEQQRPGGMALGSGFVISADGYVVTNFHVVDGAKKIEVTLDDGSKLDATFVGSDAKNDIAVLKVETDKTLSPLDWGNSDVMRLGDPVLAIGDPFGIGTTVTSGIVSARGRDLNNGPYDDFLQIDAAINHGNSGGPLLSLEGKVVGINTAIYSPNGGNVGVGFAIPSIQAKSVVEKIIANGGSIAHGYIGVMIQPVDDSVAEALGLSKPEGAIVASVGEGSPAAGAGVRAGDVIVAVNGSATESPKSVSRAIADLAPGTKATLTLWRDGETTDLSFAVGSLGEEMAQADTGTSPVQPGSVSVDDLGLTVETAATTDGAVVTAVDGPAAEKGIEAGDVIVSVNQTPVTSAKEVADLVEKVKGERGAVLFQIERNGQQSFVAVPFKTA